MMCGSPRTGIHSVRLFDLAVVDVIVSVLFAICVSYVTKTRLVSSILFVFTLGIIVHRMLKIDTKVNTMIFGHVSDKEIE